MAAVYRPERKGSNTQMPSPTYLEQFEGLTKGEYTWGKHGEKFNNLIALFGNNKAPHPTM
jgi:hypothetical protein